MSAVCTSTATRSEAAGPTSPLETTRVRQQLGRRLGGLMLVLALSGGVTSAGTLAQAPDSLPCAGETLVTPQRPPASALSVDETELVVDNMDPGFTTTGWWFIGDGGRSYLGNCAWAPRGVQNIAYIHPTLPAIGAYEIFAWWCGDPNHDQTDRATIEVYPSAEESQPYAVQVNLQVDPGEWHSLGTYYLRSGAHVAVPGSLYGNVVADAFRFVYRSPERIVALPTPAPTPVPWTNHPPSPLEQVTSGDLSMRLGLVQRFYPYTPIVRQEAVKFQDCVAFPRDGCGGTRDGWQVVVENGGMQVVYRVAADYQLVVIEAPAELAQRQTLFLLGTRDNQFLRVDRYPDATWHLAGADRDGRWAAHHQLSAAAVDGLQVIAERHSSVTTQTPSGIGLQLFGLGERAQLSAADAALLAQWVEQWAPAVWPGYTAHIN
jgi:hypothetical protein